MARGKTYSQSLPADFSLHLIIQVGHMPILKPFKARGDVHRDSLRLVKTLAWITSVVVRARGKIDIWMKLEYDLQERIGECQWDVQNKIWHTGIPKAQTKNPLYVGSLNSLPVSNCRECSYILWLHVFILFFIGIWSGLTPSLETRIQYSLEKSAIQHGRS